MEDLGLFVPEIERERILKKYDAEQQKITKGAKKFVFRRALAINFAEYVSASVMLCAIGGILSTSKNLKMPINNTNIHAVKSNQDTKKTPKTMIGLIALSVLIVLFTTAMFVSAQELDEERLENSITKDSLDKCFGLALNKYKIDSDTALRIKTAAAYIVNNLSETELKSLRKMIIRGITTDNDAISYASQIITNFINANPDAKRDIDTIMNGNEPRTYFLQGIKKVR